MKAHLMLYPATLSHDLTLGEDNEMLNIDEQVEDEQFS